MLKRTLTIDLTDRDLRDSYKDAICLIYRELPYDVSERFTAMLVAQITMLVQFTDQQFEDMKSHVLGGWVQEANKYGMVCELDTDKREFRITQDLSQPMGY